MHQISITTITRKKKKVKFQYAVKKINKTFGDWTNDDIKIYDEIASLVHWSNHEQKDWD